MPKDEFGRLIESIRVDSWLTKLLKILGEQLTLLVNNGRTDLGLLLSGVRAEELLPETQCAEVTVELPVEAVSKISGRYCSITKRTHAGQAPGWLVEFCHGPTDGPNSRAPW